jgi:hypothetical protein
MGSLQPRNSGCSTVRLGQAHGRRGYVVTLIDGGGALSLKITVLDVCDQPIPDASFTVTAVAADGRPRSNLTSPYGSSPREVAYVGPWPNTITIDATAPSFYDANVVISYDGKAWSNSGAVIIGTGDPANSSIDVRIYLCRVRFAPVSTEDLSQQYAPDYLANAVVPSLHSSVRRPPPLPDLLTSPCFDSSASAPKTIPNPIADSLEKPGGWGVWLSLEVGGPPGSKDGEIRQLIGVWAPFRTAATPSVVYQITPGTDNGDYPSDPTIPFTGIYPYGCYDPDNHNPQISGNDLWQPYVMLPLNRTLLHAAIAYQIYGACPSLYNKDNGPIIITYSPALVAGSVVVEPFDCRETMGRLIGEVLCFLWSNRITGASQTGSSLVGGTLETNAGTTTFKPYAQIPPPYDPFPKSSQTTTLIHSAAVRQLASLISNKTYDELRQSKINDKKYAAGAKNLAHLNPPTYCAGPTTYGDDNWNQLWIIDGILGSDLVPSTGSTISRLYKGWRNEWQGKDAVRSYCAVYTESTMKLYKKTDLVSPPSKLPKKDGPDWIEEGIDYIQSKGKPVLFGAWLRLSDAMVLKIPDPSRPPPDPRPGSLYVHNLIYRYGVSYCALLSNGGNIKPPATPPGPVGTILP